MYLSHVLSYILATSGAAAAAEYVGLPSTYGRVLRLFIVIIAKYRGKASLHSGRDLSGARLGIWSLNECLRLPDNG